MGACSSCQSDGESASSKLISQELRKEHQLKGLSYFFDSTHSTHQMVILGKSNSGKTALLNQLDHLYTETANMNSKQELAAINDIRQACIDNMYVICDMLNDEKSMELLEAYSFDNLPNIAKTISNLWNKTSFKIKYSYRYFYASEYVLDDNMNYFFDKINTIMNVNYHPSHEDILKHRSTNCSFQDIMFNVNDGHDTFVITDVGTVRDELYYKQMHFFSDMCVIYMVDLSGYCKNSVKEEEVNDMQESLQYFEYHIANSRYLRMGTIILLFNKDLLFTQCLKAGISIKICFPDYNGPEYGNFKLPMIASFVIREIEKEIQKIIPMEIVQLVELYLRMQIDEKYLNLTDKKYFDVCYKETLKYIEQMYITSCSDIHRQIYSHVGDVIDAKKIRKIFYDIQHCIIVQSLQKGS